MNTLFLRLQNSQRLDETQTLKLQRPIGYVPILSMFVFLLMVGVGEGLLRIDRLASILPNSNFGGRHEQLETQFARLDVVVKEEGPVNCFLLGDSLVWLGIDPEAFQNAYEEETERPLHCFNFGVSAMPAAAAAQLADYLVGTYDPDLLIYGVHARDLVVPITEEDSQIIINNPWFQYRQGKKTSINWLKAHSLIYRNMDYLRNLLRLETHTARNPLGWEYRQLHGFDPKSFALLDVNVLPNPEDPKQRDGFRWYRDYQIREENLTAVKHIADLNAPNRQIIVVVMPVHPNFMQFFGHGEQDYAQFISALQTTMAQTETPFWILDELVNIPADGWFDYSHLSLKGAGFFSPWFGHQVGNFMGSKLQSESDPYSD